MATAQKIFIGPQNIGLWGRVKQTDEAAAKVTELLQKDLENHHVFFNDSGYHNHTVHHLLALYGTGANATHLQKGFDDNTGYQRPPLPTHQHVIQELQSWDHASKYLGKAQYYADFLAFFQREIAGKGWEAVVSEYLFAGTEAADDLLVRLHGSIIHPLIQLMFGMEWGQPAVVAEALAQTCVHRNELKGELYAAEKNANEEYGKAGQGVKKMPNIVSLLEEAHEQPGLAKVDGDNRYLDWITSRPPDEVVEIMSKVKVRPEELEEKTVEMFNTVMFAAAGAAFHPPKLNKFNFFLIHFVNAAPLYLFINSQPWIPVETKIRLLEWKIRLDIFLYAAIGVPDLPLDEIKAYQPKDLVTTSVTEIMAEYHVMEDEGHAIKLARAAAICQDISKEYEDRDWMIIKGDDTWLKIHHLILDSIVSPGQKWVWSQGHEKAWKDIPDNPKL